MAMYESGLQLDKGPLRDCHPNNQYHVYSLDTILWGNQHSLLPLWLEFGYVRLHQPVEQIRHLNKTSIHAGDILGDTIVLGADCSDVKCFQEPPSDTYEAIGSEARVIGKIIRTA